MELERVARRLAVDQGYRRRAAEGLRAAGGGAGASGQDVLLRIRRLNDYLTGLAILDDDDPAAPAGPLPWEKPPTPAEEQLKLSAQAPRAPPAADSSPEDSDIEGDDETAQDSAQAVAALLAEAQAAVQRRQAAAALTIQCAYRRHRAQALLQLLREQRVAADRLVARALAAAYRGVCGSRRTLALRAALWQLRRWRRWRLRQCLQRTRHMPAAGADGEGAEAAEQQQQQPGQEVGSMASHATAAAPEPPGQPHTALMAQQTPPPSQPAPPTACSACQTDGPAAAPHPAAIKRPGSGRRVGTPPTVFIAAPSPPPPGFLPAGSPCTRSGGGSSRGSSPAQQQPWQQRQASPLSPARSGSGGSGAAQGCPASPPQQGTSSPRTASGVHSSSSRRELYRRSSSIQLLEAVQLGIDGVGGSVASQAALGVCERAQQRVQELQRCTSQGRPGTAGTGAAAGHRIGRVASGRAVRQASGRAWGGEAIPE